MLKNILLAISLYGCFIVNAAAQNCVLCAQPDDNNFKEYYAAKALKTVEDLNYKIAIIGDKKTQIIDSDKAIKNACHLFINKGEKDVFVEVLSLDHVKLYTRSVKDFFRRLRMLQWDRVEITASEFAYVDKLRLETDGNCYGTISYKYCFRYTKGSKTQSDCSTKMVAVTVAPEYDPCNKDQTRTCYTVQLGSITTLKDRIVQ